MALSRHLPGLIGENHEDPQSGLNGICAEISTELISEFEVSL
jgi:hypothetical protein